MSYISENAIATLEWRVRHVMGELRELGGDYSSRVTGSHLEAAISEQRHNLETLRSTPAGAAPTPAKPAEDYTAALNKLREEAIKANRESNLVQSRVVKLQDELTKLNTEKIKRLAKLERLEEIIKARRIDLDRDLRDEQNKLRGLKNRRVADSGTVQLKRQLDRKGKQLAEKEKLWYSYSQAKQKGSLTGGGRKKEEQALKSEVRGLKSEIRQLKEQLQKTGRVSAAAGGARTARLVRQQFKIIAGVEKELGDINKDLDRERREHDEFIVDFHKRETQINQELARHQEDQRQHQREEQDQQRKQKELEERQRQSTAANQGPAQPAVSNSSGQIQEAEQKIRNLEDEKKKADDKKFQLGELELKMNALENEIQAQEGALPSADPRQIAIWQPRLQRTRSEFRQAKEALDNLKTTHG